VKFSEAIDNLQMLERELNFACIVEYGSPLD